MPIEATQAVHWDALSTAQQCTLLQRPASALDAETRQAARKIVAKVRSGGDDALRDLTFELDKVRLRDLQVTDDEFEKAKSALSGAALGAIELAISNVRRFHELQIPKATAIATMTGVQCERIFHPIEAVGLYVPAGTAPLPSAAIMLAVPASIAGCPVRILCTPPRRDGSADPAVLTAARLSGVTAIFKVGGAQAIAAMAYGTATIPKVDKIFGPGNAWVTAAKVEVACDIGGAAVDMPAGPSEVLVIADEFADPAFVASDLLSQAEHGVDSQVVLITTSAQLAAKVTGEIERQLPSLSRSKIARQALQYSRLLVVRDLETAIEISNRYAPEHLILQIISPRERLPQVRNAGSVFLGPWSPESAGDYCSGTNHVLPTYGAARSYSGLGVDQFMRCMFVQEISKSGLRSLAPAILELAKLEGLDAHAASVGLRLGPSTADFSP